MIRRNVLALGRLVLALAVLALLAMPADAGQPSHFKHQHNNFHNQFHNNFNSGGKKVVFGTSGGSFQQHNHNHHQHRHFQPSFGPTFKVPVQQQVVFFVLVRQPSRFNDGNWHQVKSFHSSRDAEFFANSLRSKFYGDNGFAVRIDRRYW